MAIHFITFANTDSNFSTERIAFEAKKMNIFDSIKVYSENDFDDDFNQTNGKYIQKYKRGYGYWSWKPYIIKHELEQINDDDVIVYADCGCMFVYQNIIELKKWIDIVHNSESGILSPSAGPYLEHEWTRMDLYDYVNKTYNKNGENIFENTIQIGAGILTICKKTKSVNFVNDWYDVMTRHFELCTDDKSSIPNHPNFKENRHDQSVFSLLAKIYKIELIESENGILNKSISPIIATRCKNDKNTWTKPIEILFDSQIYDLQKFGGISRLYIDIANGLNTNEIYKNYTGFGSAKGKYQEFLCGFSINKTDNEYFKTFNNADNGLSNFENSVKFLKNGDFDVFYPTFFFPYFMKYIGNKPFVISVHDMIPELYPDLFNKNDIQIIGKRELVKYASAIEVNTECTKRDLMKILNVDENKIHVIGRALNPNFGNKYYNKSIFDFDYILYVGTRFGYKRFDWFVKHISKFLNNHKNIHLVCTGSDFNENEIKLLKKYKIFKRTHSVFAKDDVMMATLYKYAKFFVFPSEYEGFGMPILESYKMGCITLLNENDCFKEVTLNKGTFFNLSEKKSNLTEIAEKIYSLSEDEKNQIIQTQYDILSNYSYEKFIDNFKNMIKSVVSKKENNINDNVDLFICSHKNFLPPLKNNIYKIVDSRKINNDSWNGIKGSFYSEIMSYFYIAENIPLKDYVGFLSWRKYWNFYDNLPNIPKLIDEYEIIVAKPIIFDGSIKKQYAENHNIEDLYIVSGILAELYPSYIPTWNAYLNQNKLYPYNMFIMKKDEFIEYTNFIKSILYKYLEIVGNDIEKRVENNKEMYLKQHGENNTVSYQSRIGGYLAERLTNLWIHKNHTKVFVVEVDIFAKN